MKHLVLVMILAGCSVAQAQENNMPGLKTGWSQSGRVLTGPNSRNGVVLQARFPELNNYTIQFNVGTVVIGGTTFRPRARAFVDWGIKGNSVHREISVFDGASITGTSEGVNVTVLDDSGLTAGNAYVVSIQISQGTRASSKQPPYLVLDPQTVAPGISQAFAIPDNIGAVSIFTAIGSDAASGTGIIPAGLVMAEINDGVNTCRFDPIAHDWTPMFPGALVVTYNTDPGLPFDVVITPYLGIDG